MAGYGCVLSGEWEECGHLPYDSPQTNNQAELLAIIFILEKMQGQHRKVAVATGSQYSYDASSAFCWRRAGWVKKHGPMANVDLWIRRLNLVDQSTLTLRWINTPSHTVVVIEGNVKADLLADKGRLSSPLY